MILPTPSELEYMRSRQWEKDELEAIARKQKPDLKAIRQEFRKKTGLSRVDKAKTTKTVGTDPLTDITSGEPVSPGSDFAKNPLVVRQHPGVVPTDTESAPRTSAAGYTST